MDKQIDVADIFALVAHFGFPVYGPNFRICQDMEIQVPDYGERVTPGLISDDMNLKTAVLELQQIFQIRFRSYRYHASQR